jgi:hypothetical protein
LAGLGFLKKHKSEENPRFGGFGFYPKIASTSPFLP